MTKRKQFLTKTKVAVQHRKYFLKPEINSESMITELNI